MFKINLFATGKKHKKIDRVFDLSFCTPVSQNTLRSYILDDTTNALKFICICLCIEAFDFFEEITSSSCTLVPSQQSYSKGMPWKLCSEVASGTLSHGGTRTQSRQ